MTNTSWRNVMKVFLGQVVKLGAVVVLFSLATGNTALASVLADEQVKCTGEVTVTIAEGNDALTLTPLKTSGMPTCSSEDKQTIIFSAIDLVDDDTQQQVNSIGICKGTELQSYATISHSEVVNQHEVQLYLECQRDGITNSNRNEPGCWPEMVGCYYRGAQLDPIFILTF
jgi:hypothetical protein